MNGLIYLKKDVTLFIRSSLNRRDFRLLIANPDDPNKSMANPVFWSTIDLVIEVNICSLNG